ncbi:MAG: zinc ribbon domain-containing protein [Methanobacteriota archaeon]|nr:MAG: zinc ribbon domain-containing protein [Euryarchaeota archaeon]
MQDRNRFYFAIPIILLMLLSFSPVESQIKTIRIVDQPLGEISSTQRIDNTHPQKEDISLASGTDFSDAISIPMVKEGNVRRGTREFQLNSSFSFIFFKYNINETSPVSVTVNAATGTTVDENQYEVAMDVYQGSGYEDWVDFKSTSEFDLPMTTDYPADKTGDHFVVVYATDLVDFEFGPGEFVSLNVTIQHFKAGAVRSNEKTSTFQSDPINLIFAVQDYLSSSNFIDLDTATVNLGLLDQNDPDFAKVIGLSVYGLLKTSETLAKVNNPDITQMQQTLARYVNLAYEIFKLANNTMLEPTNGLFYYRPNESNPGLNNFVTYLSDNVYMLIALNEIQYFAGKSGSASLNFDLSQITQFIVKINERIVAMFKQSQGNYTERLEITGYNEDANTDVFDASDYASLTVSPINSLESYALLAENFYWAQLFPIFQFSPANEMEDLVSYLITNMNVTSVAGKTLNHAGIFASYYNATSGGPSDEIDLIGNSFLVSHLNTYAKQTAFSTALNKGPEEVLQVASQLMENILRIFSEDNGDSFLLYSKVNSKDSSLNEKAIRNIDNVAAIFAMNRIAVNWETYNPGNSGAAITRSWKIRSLLGLDALHERFFDEREHFYFGYWDDQGKKFIVDNNQVDKNIFLANTFIEAVLADMFPVEMVAIEQPDLLVGDEGQITLGLSQFVTDGTWIWWDPFKPFTFDIKVTIPKFDYVKTETVLLDSFNAQDTLYIPFTYEITERGVYDVQIELSTEGLVLLSQTVQSRALGVARTEFGIEAFSITDSTYATDLTFIDEKGDVLSSLQVSGSLGLPFDDSIPKFDQKYIRSGRTDTSGKLELTFSVKDLSDDGLVNLTELYSQDPIPPFKEIFLYLNITNSGAFNLESRILVVPVRVLLNRVNMRVSPTNLEITQGTTETFTFSVTALDQNQNPIKDASISYRVKEIPEIKNTVFTDLDGEATISFRDQELFALSNLAIIANQGRNTNNLETINVTIEMTLNSSLYPVRTIERTLTILPNSLVITANPVQLSVKEANIIEQSIPPIDVEVAVSDIFSRVVNAFVSITWSDPKINDIVPLNAAEKHLSPYTFSVDVSSLPAGNYTLLIIAEKDGITSTVEIDTNNPGLSLAQVPEIHRPVITARNIVIESSTVEDVAISLFSVLSALAIAKGIEFLGGFSLQVIGITRKCPFCDEVISSRVPVCPNCGRDVKDNEKPKDTPEHAISPPEPQPEEEEPAKEM